MITLGVIAAVAAIAYWYFRTPPAVAPATTVAAGTTTLPMAEEPKGTRASQTRTRIG